MLNIINSLKDSFVHISKLIRYSNSITLSTTLDVNNISGDFVKQLDIETNNIIKNKLLECPNIRAIGSEEEDHLYYTNNIDEEYLVCYDPLDGSSNIDANITVGTIFAIYKYNNNRINDGNNIVCSGYCLYGGSTQLIIATDTVQMLLLNNENQFTIINENIVIKDTGNIYSINEANKYLWDKTIYNDYINLLIKNKYTSRWVGSMVADGHRTLIKGGIFCYPENKNSPEGKIRLLYEAYPFAYIFKIAGGHSSNGVISILDIPFPENIHQKTPILLSGNKEYQLFISLVKSI